MKTNFETEDAKLECCIIEGRKGKFPLKAHPDDAGFDFFAPLDMEEVELKPGEDYVVQTGVRVGVPKGWALLGVNKSGVATKKKLTLGAKLIDAGYTGELGIHLVNIGTKIAKISPGDKIAQFVMIPIGISTVEELTEEEYWRRNSDTERGCGGFGSTGEK
jgi:dUTPase